MEAELLLKRKVAELQRRLRLLVAQQWALVGLTAAGALGCVLAAAAQLRWLPAAGAESYLVTGRLSDGRAFKKTLSKRRLVLKRVGKKITGRFTITGLNEVGGPGRRSTARLRTKRR